MSTEARATGPEGSASVGRTLSLARPAAGRLALASLLGAGALSASMALLGVSGWLISRAAEHPPESALALAIAGVQLFGLSRGFLRYGERLVGHDAAFRLLAALRVRVYGRLEQVAPAGLAAFGRGDLLARVVDDVDSLQDVVLRVLAPVGVAAVAGAAAVGVLWAILPGAGAVLLVAMVVSATVVPWFCSWLARRVEAHQASVRGDLAAAVVDLVDGQPELTIFGGMAGQLAAVDDADRRLRATARHGAGTRGAGLALITLFMGGACWASLATGAAAVDGHRLDGVLLAVCALLPLAAFEVVSPLPAAAQALERSRRAAERVLAVTEAALPVEEPEFPLAIGPGPHRLRLRGVTVRHPGVATSALDGIDLDLDPGRRVAIVGPSGAGKSTLADVLVGFLPVASGEATLDGVPLGRLSGQDLRRVVGLMEQQPHLFDATIAENLRIGRRSATDAELEDVLGRVGLAGWLTGLPDGLVTEVGTNGSRLSGGQQRRLSLARALLADFPILVLDEPGEHLEPSAADALVADVLAVTEGRSVLLVTHRLAGLDQVDEIVFLDGGQVVERGTHADLVGVGGRYASWWWNERMHRTMPDPSPSMEVVRSA